MPRDGRVRGRLREGWVCRDEGQRSEVKGRRDEGQRASVARLVEHLTAFRFRPWGSESLSIFSRVGSTI